MQNQAASSFNGELNEYVENVRKIHGQIIDLVNPDKVTAAGWDKDNKDKANEIVQTFADWVARHKDEITVLIFILQSQVFITVFYPFVKTFQKCWFEN